jgi:hypothetical protein
VRCPRPWFAVAPRVNVHTNKQQLPFPFHSVVRLTSLTNRHNHDNLEGSTGFRHDAPRPSSHERSLPFPDMFPLWKQQQLRASQMLLAFALFMPHIG